MKAITVEPKKPGTAQFEDMPEPDVNEGSVLVEAVAVGVCGTDSAMCISAKMINALVNSRNVNQFSR